MKHGSSTQQVKKCHMVSAPAQIVLAMLAPNGSRWGFECVSFERGRIGDISFVTLTSQCSDAQFG